MTISTVRPGSPDFGPYDERGRRRTGSTGPGPSRSAPPGHSRPSVQEPTGPLLHHVPRQALRGASGCLRPPATRGSAKRSESERLPCTDVSELTGNGGQPRRFDRWSQGTYAGTDADDQPTQSASASTSGARSPAASSSPGTRCIVEIFERPVRWPTSRPWPAVMHPRRRTSNVTITSVPGLPTCAAPLLRANAGGAPRTPRPDTPAPQTPRIASDTPPQTAR